MEYNFSELEPRWQKWWKVEGVYHVENGGGAEGRPHFYVLDRLIFDDTGNFEKQKKQIIRYLRGNIGFILSDKRFKITRKFAMVLLAIHSDLYKLCIKLQNRRYKVK